MDKYKKGKNITSLDELMQQDVIFFYDKPLNKALFQNWQMAFTMNMIHQCAVFKAHRRLYLFNEYEKGINDCLDIVEKVQAECIKNDGCRNKCDEPYACAYANRIFGEILALKEQKNDD